MSSRWSRLYTCICSKNTIVYNMIWTSGLGPLSFIAYEGCWKTRRSAHAGRERGLRVDAAAQEVVGQGHQHEADDKTFLRAFEGEKAMNPLRIHLNSIRNPPSVPGPKPRRPQLRPRLQKRTRRHSVAVIATASHPHLTSQLPHFKASNNRKEGLKSWSRLIIRVIIL